jgi:hypothetical protein
MRLAAAALLVAVAPAFAEHPPGLAPDSPRDGAITGRKPRFVVRTSGAEAESARFRIELSQDGFRTIAYTFDQLADANGWVYAVLDGGGSGAVYAPRKPIGAGRYAWRVSSWDGVTWRVGAATFRLDVDVVPPADVSGLAMARRADGCVSLAWDPVVSDAQGGVERIGVYHVLRFTTATPPAGGGTSEVGEAKVPLFEDCDPALADKPLLYYRVVPEDEAGNVAVPPSSARR